MPRHGRSSPHPSDPLKVIGAPILHANADDPEAVVAAMQLAADWRARCGEHACMRLCALLAFDCAAGRCLTCSLRNAHMIYPLVWCMTGQHCFQAL